MVYLHNRWCIDTMTIIYHNAFQVLQCLFLDFCVSKTWKSVSQGKWLIFPRSGFACLPFQSSFCGNTIWCQIIIRSVVNRKYFSQTGSVLATFYICYRKVHVVFSGDLEFVPGCDQSVPSQGQRIKLVASVLVYWNVRYRPTLGFIDRLQGDRSQLIPSPVIAQFWRFCIVFLLKVKLYNLNFFEMEFLSNTLPASSVLLMFSG